MMTQHSVMTSSFVSRPLPPRTADTVTHALLMTSETTREYTQVCRHGSRVGDYWFVSAVGSGIQKSILSVLTMYVIPSDRSVM